MNVTSDMDAEGTLAINMLVSANELDLLRKRDGHRALLRDRLLAKLDEAFTRWTQIDLGLLEHEDEAPAEAADEPDDEDDPRTEIQVGDWVRVFMDGRSVYGELVVYDTEEVALRDRHGRLIDVWPRAVTYVAQDSPPQPEENERGPQW